MKYSLSIAALAAIASAGPIIKRALTDVQILNYALTLEHLEDKFYREGLANYTQADFVTAGFPDPFYKNLCEVSHDETAHVSFLSGALGNAAVAECTYAFPSTDAKSFVALAQVLENVGVSAYLGAAKGIANKDYLTAAGGILTVEARHNAYLRAARIMTPFPQPFDDPLSYDEVYTLAASFIVSCPASNAGKPQLPLKAFPQLALGTTGTIKSGNTITLLTPGYVIVPGEGQHLYSAFITILGPIYGEAHPTQGGWTVTVPEGVNGNAYVVLTGCNDVLNDDTITAGPAIVEVTNF